MLSISQVRAEMMEMERACVRNHQPHDGLAMSRGMLRASKWTTHPCFELSQKKFTKGVVAPSYSTATMSFCENMSRSVWWYQLPLTVRYPSMRGIWTSSVHKFLGKSMALDKSGKDWTNHWKYINCNELSVLDMDSWSFSGPRWRFPEMGVPLNHPILNRIFPYKPAILEYPILGNPQKFGACSIMDAPRASPNRMPTRQLRRGRTGRLGGLEIWRSTPW